MATGLTVYSGNVPNKQSDTSIEFADNIFAYQTWIDSSFVTDFNNSILSINADILSMNNDMNNYMTTTEGYKNDAQTALADTIIAKDAVYQASNMKGAWANLSGALNVPATVTHNGHSWILNNNLADVTASEPDKLNNDWMVINGGFKYTTENSNYIALPNDFIYADTSLASFTITLPATPLENDVVSILDSTSSFDTNPLSVARNGNNIMGLAEDMTVDKVNANVTFIFNGNEWRIENGSAYYARTNSSASPTLDIPSLNVNENTVNIYKISNYNANGTYFVSAVNGTATVLNDEVTYVSPVVSSDTIDTLSISVNDGSTMSPPTKYDLTVLDVASADTTIQVVDFTTEASVNVGWDLI